MRYGVHWEVLNGEKFLAVENRQNIPAFENRWKVQWLRDVIDTINNDKKMYGGWVERERQRYYVSHAQPCLVYYLFIASQERW